MNSDLDPSLWRELADDPLQDGLVRRRVLPGLTHDVFVAERRPSRERVLIMEIKDSTCGLPTRRPSSRGLRVEIDSSDDEMVKVRLTSTSVSGDSLFAELADDVVGVLATDPGEGAAARVLNRIVAWQAFFANRREEFSLENAAGLFAELHVLNHAFLPAVGLRDALEAWCGPDPAVQDFQCGTLAIEVKSFRGTGPGQLIISSERQLELTGVKGLFVAYVRLDQRQDGTGVTLLETIEGLRRASSESALAFDLLQQRLLSYGWHDSYADFRREKYEVRSSELFRVDEVFPRITSAGLPNGVGAVSYSIDRSAIEDFLIPWDEFAEILKEQR